MNRRATIAFAIAAVVWGMPYLLIKVAVDDGLAPTFVAWARVVIATAVMLPLAWRLGALRGMRPHLRILLAVAIFEMTLPFPLIAAGEQFVSSSVAAILIASCPLMIAALAWRFDAAERVSGARLLGLLIGLGGVVVLLGIDVAGRPEELAGAGMILVAAVGYAIAPMLLKRPLAAAASPIGPVTVAMAITSVLLTPVGLLGMPAQLPSVEAIVALLVLAIACGAIGFVAFFTVIAEAGPSRASVIAYLNPVVAVALGMLILGERPGPGTIIGLVLILVGSWIATGARLPRPRRSTPPMTGETPTILP